MLPDAMREALAEKVRLHFQNNDKDLINTALRLQDNGYPDAEIFDILTRVYNVGYEDGFTDGYDQCNDGA